ncbi:MULTISPECIES: MFS transporter [Nocardiopsidaceae]|uniref:MFS transporter n=1 Tax=Streptomonospora nanhaiensis TaxID=1323731 RepID=A0ABY6YSF6_9ACTN|nr:MFS transporter [Streptomonospora nanhaiensis]WAE75036.1 MFS transporter [Streptomonospora nanhaiensis]
MRPTPASAPPAPSTSALLAVLVAAMLLMVVASDMVGLVLPLMGEQFAASEAQLAWVVTGFLLVFSVGIPVYGRVSDRVGLRSLFRGALLVYAAGSLVCALAPTLPLLVLGRLVMGAGAAAVPVLSVIAVTRVLPPGRRGTGIGFVSAAGGAGAALGPSIGGGIGELLGWPALFWITMAGALLLAAASRVLPDDAPGDARPFDLLGGVLLGLAAGLVLFGVTRGQESGFDSPSSYGSVLASATAAALFAWRTVRSEQPFVPPALFADRVYVSAVATVFLAMFVNMTALVFVPLLVVGVNGLGPGAGSLVMIPGGVALAVLSPLAGRVAGSAAARWWVVGGLALMGASTFHLSVHGASPAAAALGVVGVGAGFAFVATLVTDSAAGALPPDRVGVGMGVLQGAQFLGAGTGPALIGALVAARQAGGHDAVNPLHTLAAPAYSDAFLAVTLVAVLGAASALGLARRPTGPAADPVRT